MNPREKRMVLVLGALLALLVAWTVQNQYRKKIAALDAELARLENDRNRIELDQNRLRHGMEAWSQAGQQTLAEDDGKAQTLFRPDIDALVQEVGLKNGSVALKGVAKSGKNGLRNLNCTVIAEGNLESILQFLFKVRQRLYAVRCREITIDQLTGKNVAKNTLRMTVDLDTLLMPDARAEGLPRVMPVNLASQPAEPPIRTRLAQFEDYQDIIKRKVFEPWTPPIPKPGKVVGHVPSPGGQLAVNAQQLRWNAAPHAKTYEVYLGEENPPPSVGQGLSAPTYQPLVPLVLGKTYYWRVDSINEEGVRTDGDVLQFTVFQPTTPTPPPTPVVVQPPEDANLVLARIVSWDGSQQVVLENPSNKAADDKRVEIGETLHGGTLVFVHPKGAVSQKDDKLWYHPVTKALRECVPLTEEAQPELHYEVMKLEQRAAGISQRPG